MLALSTHWPLWVTRPATISYRSTLLLYDRELGLARQWRQLSGKTSWSWRHRRELSSRRSRVTPELVEADKHTPNEKDRTAAVRPGARRPYKAWSTQEIASLVEMRRTGSSWSQVRAALPSRGWGAVYSRALTLGLSRTRKVTYSSDEDTKLLKLRSDGETWHTIAKSMPNRTREALKLRYYILRKLRPIPAIPVTTNATTVETTRGLKWSVAEVDQLRQLRQELRLPWPEIFSRMSHRTPSAILSFFRTITPQKSESWTAEEISRLQTLKEGDPQVAWTALVAQFPGRTAMALSKKWHVTLPADLRRISWSRAERAKLLDLRALGLGWREICECFPGRTRPALKAQCYKHFRSRDSGQTPHPNKEA